MQAKFSISQTVYVPWVDEVVKSEITSVTRKPSFFTGELFFLYGVSGIFSNGNKFPVSKNCELLMELTNLGDDIILHNGSIAYTSRFEWEENIFTTLQEAQNKLLIQKKKIYG